MRFGRNENVSEGLVRKVGRAAAVGICTVSLITGSPAFAAPAKAQTSAEARAKAKAENARLDELVGQLDAGRAEVDDLEKQIRELAEQSIAVQGDLIEDRSQLSTMVETEYRWGGMPSLWNIALSSETFDDFISRLYYANKVTQWKADCVDQLDEDKRNLDDRMNQIEVARNDRKAALEGLEQTCGELRESVSALLEMAEGLEAEERAAEQARLAEIARQAAIQEERAAKKRQQAKAESQVRDLALRAATDATSLEAEAEEDEARAAAAKIAAQEAKDGEEAASPNKADTEKPSGEEPAQSGDTSDEDVDEDGASSEESADEATNTETDASQPEDANGTEGADTEKESTDGEEASTEEEANGEEDESDPETAAPAEALPEPNPEPEPEPAAEPEPEPEADTEYSASDAGNWISCIASAYSIADNTPPGSTATASGIPLDESVPTVAMPISSNPAQFYGSMIQIEYNGMTVIATVTDCGGMGGGSRGLDLTPAVFRAFGAGSCDEWGLREVRYRFL